MIFDKFEVVPGDLVVVVFVFVEGLFVVFHHLVDVQVFALFKLVDLHSQFELQLLFHLFQLAIVLTLSISQLPLILVVDILLLFAVVFL
jgi:hypothetical protein